MENMSSCVPETLGQRVQPRCRRCRQSRSGEVTGDLTGQKAEKPRGKRRKKTRPGKQNSKIKRECWKEGTVGKQDTGETNQAGSDS